MLPSPWRPSGLRLQAGVSRQLPSLLAWQASPEEFIPIFANNSRELRAFLEHMSEVQPDSPQGVYDTLLELRLQGWGQEQDPKVGMPVPQRSLYFFKKSSS